MIKPHSHVPHPAVLPLPAHVAPAEDGGSHRYERGEDCKIDIEGIDKEKLTSRQHRAVIVDLEGQPKPPGKICGRAKDIDLRGKLSVSNKGKYNGRGKRHNQ